MLRGWLFQEAVRLCNLGRQSKSDRRAVYDSLSAIDSIEYRALWAASNLSENKILELLGRWGKNEIEPSEFLEAMGFCPEGEPTGCRAGSGASAYTCSMRWISSVMG